MTLSGALGRRKEGTSECRRDGSICRSLRSPRALERIDPRLRRVGQWYRSLALSTMLSVRNSQVSQSGVIMLTGSRIASSSGHVYGSGRALLLASTSANSGYWTSLAVSSAIIVIAFRASRLA